MDVTRGYADATFNSSDGGGARHGLGGAGGNCPLERATYGQPGDSWVLEITPRPADGAANEFVGVKLTGPEGFPPYEGGIFVPNGFGQPMVDLAPQCGAGGTAGCVSYSDVIYALMPMGIEQFPYDFNAPVTAPAQILFPGFAAGVWYSPYREAAFSKPRARRCLQFRQLPAGMN